MVDRIGADPVALARLDQGRAYEQARSACLFCRKTDACLRWLDARSETDRIPEFCPNLELLMALRKLNKNG